MAQRTRITEDGQGNVLETQAVEVPDEVVRAETVREKVAQALDALEAADENWDRLSAAQRSDAMRLAVRTAAKLARLQLHRFEKG